VWLALAIAAAIVAAVLFVPIRIEMSISKEAGSSAARVRGRVRWLFIRFRLGESARTRARRPKKPEIDKARRRRRVPAFIRARMRAAVRSPGFVPRLLRLIVDLLRLAKPDQVRIDVRAGFEDPAETGMFIGSAFAACNAAGWRHVRITPEFLEPVFAGHADLQWSRSVASLAGPLFRFTVESWRA
jgi:hypothetical protein